jgi:hypothetical protein
MGKKFITLLAQSKRYRLYSEDIQNVFQKPIRKVPHIPRFIEAFKAYDEDTEESCGSA